MRERHLSRVPFFLILLLAFFIRVYHLDGQSMWSDEGLSLYRIHQPVSQQLQNIITVDGVDTRDTNPPFYFLLLHGWSILTGDTVFALRYGGVLLALLAIPLIYQLTALGVGKNAGLAAAFLLAISPFHVWQSQVLRNYGLLITLNLFSLYGLWRFIRGGPQARRWLWLWAVAGLLGIYSHYFGFFIFAYGLVALTVTTSLNWGKQQLSHLLRQRWFWAGLALSLLILLPAIFIGLDRFRAGQQIDFNYIPPGTVAYHALSAFAVGMSRSLTHPWSRLWPALLLALGGFFWLWRQKRSPALLVLGYQLIPLGLLQLLSLVNPLYNGTRHLLIGLPPFLILLAAAFTLTHPRWLRLLVWSLGLVAVAIQIDWLQAQFTSPQLVRDDVRGVALYLNEHAAADDLIILHDTLISFTFDYYYNGAAPWRAIPLYGEQDAAAAANELAAAGAATTGRIWFLTQPTPRTGFPITPLPQWASENWLPIGTRQFPHMWLSVRLETYLPNPVTTSLPASITPLEQTFDDTLHLHGLSLPTTIRAGQPFWLQSYWSQTATEPGRYSLSLRWQDESGHIWTQIDHNLWPGYPIQNWPTATPIRFDQEITLPASLPPGPYTVWLRLTNPAGQQIPDNSGQLDVRLGDMQVTPSSLALDNALATVAPFTSQESDLGPLTLLGYRLPTTALRPGHLLPLELIWQARRTPTQDYQLRTRLINGQGEMLSETITPLTRASYPTSQWVKGALAEGVISLLIPGLASSDDTYVELSLLTSEGNPVGKPVRLAENLLVEPWALVTELPPITNPLQANFGEPTLVELPGYALSATTAQPGDTLDLTLYWQAQQPINVNYLVFVHLVDAQENVWGQATGVPVNGSRPTLSWRMDEVLLDNRPLVIGSDVPPGQYNLWVGFFEPDSGVRLPVSGAAADPANGRVLLTPITITATD